MALAPGTRLGPYKVLSALGAGGMGEVYKATDTRLSRTVAIKVLPEHVASDTELKQRFEREAKTLATLSHPHICPVFDVGSQAGIDFLVMEYLEGETLERRLKKGALPLDQALQIGTRIAEALAAAHRAGIVHRDLKPGNIMLTKSGARLLDFGLAKLRPAGVAGGMALSEAPTVSSPLTGAGSILGTFQYMAPEQLEGQEADARTDIFAFGSVLYEMVTGKKAFEGKSQASLISAIMSSEPLPIARLQPMVSAAVDRLVTTCLAKDPDERWQSASDLSRELKWIAATESQETGSSSRVRTARSPVGNPRVAWTISAFAILATATLAVLYIREPRSELTPVLFTISSSAEADFGSTQANAAAFQAVSPDGRQLVFVARSGGSNSLWIRSLDSLETRPLPGTEGATVPFWSPDSRFIGFSFDGKLMKIAASAGPAQTLCDVAAGRGATWNRDGVIVFASINPRGLFQVSASGGQPTPITRLDPSRKEIAHTWPQFLPDGRRFLYLSLQTEGSAVNVGSLDSQQAVQILASDTKALYTPSGHLLFVRRGALLAQRFDPQRGVLGGDPLPIAEQVATVPANGRAAFSVSENGVVTYVNAAATLSELVWFDRTGKRLGSIAQAGPYNSVTLAPDEKQVAVGRFDPKVSSDDIWVVDVARGVPTRVTSDPATDSGAQWSPDGRGLAFFSMRVGGNRILYKSLTGSDEKPLGPDLPGSPLLEDWSHDGRYLIALLSGSVWAVPLAGDAKPFPIAQTTGADEPQLSPDGRWLAYMSNESGRWEIYVAPFPGPGERVRLSVNGGSQPKWRADSKELFYLTLDGTLMAVELKTEAAMEATAPRALFQAGIDVIPVSDQYAVTSDGQRFLTLTPVGGEAQSAITVVVNWPALLKP